MIRRSSTFRALAFACLSALASATQAAAYDFQVIQPIAGNHVAVHDINNLGQIVGASSTASVTTAAVMWQSGTATLLEQRPSGASEAYGINDDGVIVGYSRLGNGPIQALVWDGSATRTLPAMGADGAVATVVNNAGQMAGYSYLGSGLGTHAVRWDEGGAIHDLELSGVYRSRANAINDSGVIAGESLDSIGNPSAVVWDGGRQVELGGQNWYYSRAVGINNRGQVIGNAAAGSGSGAYHSILWDRQEDGSYSQELLRSLGGTLTDTFALAINEQGVIVGSSTPQGATEHAVIWHDNEITDLNSLVDASVLAEGWVLSVATGVNDNNWIIGLARNEGLGIYRPFILTPAVPEPSTWIMMCLGGFAIVSRRKQFASCATVS